MTKENITQIFESKHTAVQTIYKGQEGEIALLGNSGDATFLAQDTQWNKKLHNYFDHFSGWYAQHASPFVIFMPTDESGNYLSKYMGHRQNRAITTQKNNTIQKTPEALTKLILAAIQNNPKSLSLLADHGSINLYSICLQTLKKGNISQDLKNLRELWSNYLARPSWITDEMLEHQDSLDVLIKYDQHTEGGYLDLIPKNKWRDLSFCENAVRLNPDTYPIFDEEIQMQMENAGLDVATYSI